MLEGMRVLVIGAGGLLGGRLVESLLTNGAFVIAVDLDVDSMKRRLTALGVKMDGESVSLSRLDVTCEASVVTFFQGLQGIEGAVNCAYPRNSSYGAKFYDVGLDSFNENVSLHLGSAFLVMQQCAKYFEKSKSPLSVVNIASVYGCVMPKFSQEAY